MKRVALVILVLVIVAAVGVVLTRSGDDESSTAAGGSAPAGGPLADSTVPMDVPPSPEAAAARSVALTGEVVTAGLISRRELIESFTTPGFAGELANLTSKQVTEMRLSMAETGRSTSGLSVVEFPLRTRTLAHDGTTARVEVWSVMVVAAADEPVARQAWRTVTVELQLVEGRWLVDGWSSAAGPAPAAAPDGAIAPIGDVADRLGWTEVG